MPSKGKSQRKNKKGKGGRGGASASADRHEPEKLMQVPCDKGNTTSEPNGVTIHADQETRVETQQLEMPSGAISAAVATAVASGYITSSMQKYSSPTATTIDKQQSKSSLSATTTTTATVPSGAVDAAIKAAIEAPAAWLILDRYSSYKSMPSHVATGSDGTTNTDDQNIKSAPQSKATTHDHPPAVPDKAVDAAVNAAIAAPVATQAVENLSSSSVYAEHQESSPPPPPLPKEPQSLPPREFPKDQHHNVPSSATPTALEEQETDMTEQSISEAIQTSMVQPPPRSVQAPIPSSQIPSMSPSPPPLPPPPSEYYRQRRREGHREQQQQSLCRIL